jgi:peroxiredoxin
MRAAALALSLLAATGCATAPASHCSAPPVAAEGPAAALADCTCNVDGAPSVGSAPVGRQAALPPVPLPDTRGESVDLRRGVAAAPLTVVTFFSATCPCQRAHDQRLGDYYREFAGRGVAFFVVDSEAGSSLERDRREASERAYPFPILSDPRGTVADAVGAHYATETLILDQGGRVRFRGGLDSDQNRARADARLWVREALVALLDGHEPAQRNPKSYGCSLRRR